MWRVNAFDREGREVARFELAAGELTIGREADRHLVLQSASVSRRHARIVVEGGQPRIFDEGSSNGVLVDGVRITGPTPVGPQNRIDIAEFRVTVESVGAGTSMPPPLGGAPVPLNPGGPMAAPLGMPMAPPAGAPMMMPPAGMPYPRQPAPPQPLRLTAEGGPYDGRVFNIRPGIMTVGRAVDNDLVFEDPSLSRKHARIHASGELIELEDLGSSNGTFINSERIQRGSAGGGDVIRFGDLSFRLEGGAASSTRNVGRAALPKPQFYALVGGGGFTLLMLILAVIFLVRPVAPVAASGTVGIAKIERSAEVHLDRGRQLYKERKFIEAKIELDQAYDLDPANVEIRKLRTLATRAPEDEHNYRSALAMAAIVDRKELERALHAWDEITDGAPQRAQLAARLASQLDRLARESCGRKQWQDCAWALCREYDVAPSDARPEPRSYRLLREAEKHLVKDRGFQRCKTATPG